jgi:hypothetical protein
MDIDVYYTSIDVYCTSTDVYCTSTDVYCTSIDVCYTSIDVYYTSIDVYCTSIDVYCTSLNIQVITHYGSPKQKFAEVVKVLWGYIIWKGLILKINVFWEVTPCSRVESS